MAQTADDVRGKIRRRQIRNGLLDQPAKDVAHPIDVAADARY